MTRTRSLRAAAFIVFATTFSVGVHAQDAPKPPGGDGGCTTANGVSTGAGCTPGTSSPAAGTVENGMPATEHQQELLKTDDKAVSGQNMDASGAGGSALPETEHQQDVLKKPEAGADKGTTTQP